MIGTVLEKQLCALYQTGLVLIRHAMRVVDCCRDHGGCRAPGEK